MDTLHNQQNLSGSDSGTIILYQTEDGQTKLDVKLQDETVWLSLTQMAVLFKRDKSVISRHLNNIFGEGELDREAVIAKNATTASDGAQLIFEMELDFSLATVHHGDFPGLHAPAALELYWPRFSFPMDF
jgi:hypothetical protein